MTKVMLVDDQKLFVEGLAMLLEGRPGLSIVGRANSGAEAIELALQHRPDLILIDVFMNGINGIEAVRSIRTTLKESRIIALSSYAEKEPVLQMLNAGANGYVLKANAFTELSFAIDAVLRGNIFLSPEVSGFVVQGALDPRQGFSAASLLDVLTPRERMVLQLLCEDQAPKDIALKLNISRKTVDVHKRNLMEKLGVSTSAGLFRLASREGLI
jgi:DNA-binding NarL/FixJ family response regulator